jgi:hypothetical protein
VSQADSTTLESLIKRDQLWVLASVVWATALTSLHLLSMATEMEAMGNAMLSARGAHWTSADFALIFVM